MRTYVYEGRGPMRGRWVATVPEIPGAACADLPTRDEALAYCRRVSALERDALERLGAVLTFDPRDAVVDWAHRPSLIPEMLLPVAPGLLRVVLCRIDELAAALERRVGALAGEGWDHAREGWTSRTIVDHVASGNVEMLAALEPWPLDREEARRTALEELLARLVGLAGIRCATEQFGLNPEGRRVRWTPRKVARVVERLQEGWLAHLERGAPIPELAAGHADDEGDEEPLDLGSIAALRANDAALRVVASDERVGMVGFWYRYYRHRLDAWPLDERERWRVTLRALRDRLAALDETELALVRVAPNGTVWTVRQVLGVEIVHLRDHEAQIAANTAGA